MKKIAACFALWTGAVGGWIVGAEPPPTPGREATPLFDGRTLAGWEGDAALWRVEEGAIRGGSLEQTMRHNDFLATTRSYTNFVVRMQIKLTGREGFINSGFQIRSQRVPNSSEMAGYQCDYGDPNWWGAIYDESRRNKVMSASDMKALGPIIRRQDWNEYVIRADGPRITTWINGVQGTDYTEADPNIADYGKLGIQVHGGGKALVEVKDIAIEELPPTPEGKKFRGAPVPGKATRVSPLTPEEEHASFTLAPGFEIELVAAEAEGLGKFVTVDWDTEGRMWSMTALEYPVDANENAAAAEALYTSKARDKVVVWDTPYGPGPHPARVFAEGLAIPLGILPYKNGVYVQHGPDIVFLSDTDHDGRADRREMILSGFGVQDSHLFPHQFTRAPGGWIWMAQGAFNYGKVRTTKGEEIKFDQTRMARLRYDGSDFDITSQGPCNIWGLVLTTEGECFIQEANDYGYPVMPFHAYANYPGCSDSQFKSYAPEFPGTAPHFKMGGTGLSGLALSDPVGSGAWPEAYADVMYVANPITRKIQAIKMHRQGSSYRLQLLPDFVQSSDEMFRPVALRLGPDGCLYIVDWYNKIISHNEVPRTHPERDKTRGRIWRVKHREQKPFPVPDFTKLSGPELLAKLGGPSQAQSHLAWQAITDRQMKTLEPGLRSTVTNRAETAGRRIASLWAWEGIGQPDVGALKIFLSDTNRNVRREGVRALGQLAAAGIAANVATLFEPLMDDPDAEVRAEVLRAVGPLVGTDAQAMRLCVALAREGLPGPLAASTHNGKQIKVGAAYDREFERYLARLFLEKQPKQVAAFLDTDAAAQLPLENRLVATLALEPKASARRLAELLPKLTRAPAQEEVLRLAQSLAEPGVGEAMQSLLGNPATSAATMDSLLKVRSRIDAARLGPMLDQIAHKLWSRDEAGRGWALRLTSAFKLDGLAPEITSALVKGGEAVLATNQVLPALQALREVGSVELEGFLAYVKSPKREWADEAVLGLASSRQEKGSLLLCTRFWPDLTVAQRRTALGALTSTRAGSVAVVAGLKAKTIDMADIDILALERLAVTLPTDPDLAALRDEMAPMFRPALRLDGSDNAWVESEILLSGPFTVETWVKLDAGISNDDGILGAPGTLDINFADAKFRVWVAGGLHDVIVAKKPIVAETWTHLAVSRDTAGKFRIYINGELDTDRSKIDQRAYDKLRVGWTVPAKGTAGWLTEYRIWNRERSADEIRAQFDWSYEKEVRPGDLVHYFPGSGPWGNKLGRGAAVQRTGDFPTLLTVTEAKAQAAAFAKYRQWAEAPGEAGQGGMLFQTLCSSCHSVGGEGGQVGPVLGGTGALGTEALLRNILTPNAAMEAGYRVFRVELKNGDVLDGLLVSQDDEAFVLRRPNTADMRIPQRDVRRAGHTRTSMMPEGLLESLQPAEVAALFAYLRGLK